MLDVILWLQGLIYVGACLWVILVVLIQEGKSGGMSAMGGGSQTPSALADTFGAGGAEKSLFRWTSWSAAVFLGLALVLTLLGNVRERSGGDIDLGPEPAPATRTIDIQPGQPTPDAAPTGEAIPTGDSQ